MSEKKFVIVHNPDSKAVGPFSSESEANNYVKTTPNELFSDDESYEHAETNADFVIVQLISPIVKPKLGDVFKS